MSANVLSGKLTRNQQRAIPALLQSSTLTEAAALVKVNVRTLQRWLDEPEFQAALKAAEGTAISATLRDLVRDMTKNQTVMRSIRDDIDNPPAVRLRAALGIDGSLLKWREIVSFEDRLAALEKAVFDEKQRNL